MDYSKWEGLDGGDEDVEEDPMQMPVCSEIPWHQMGPVVEHILDHQYGPDPASTGAEVPLVADGSCEGGKPSSDAEQADTCGRALVLKERGNAAFKCGDHSAALAAWTEAEELAVAADDSELWMAVRANLSLVELKRNNWVRVEALTTELLTRTPRHEKALYRRGVAFEQTGRLELAQADFQAALAINPLNREARESLGRVDRRSQPAPAGP